MTNNNAAAAMHTWNETQQSPVLSNIMATVTNNGKLCKMQCNAKSEDEEDPRFRLNSINLYDQSPRFFQFLAHKTTIKASHRMKQSPHILPQEASQVVRDNSTSFVLSIECHTFSLRKLTGIETELRNTSSKMRLRKLPPLVAISYLLSLFLCGCGGARTVGGGVGIGSSSGDSSSKDGISTHRQYSHSLDTGSSVSYGSKPVVASLASASASNSGGGSSYASGESGSRGNNGFASQSSVEYGGAAEATGNFNSLFPGSSSSSGYQPSSSSGGYPSASPGGYPSSSSGGYPSSSSGGYPSASPGGYPSSVGNIPSPSPSSPSHNIQGQHPPDMSQPHGPAYTYYYQHYPTGAVSGGGGSSATGGWSGGNVEGHEEGGMFGELGGAGGGGIAGVGGLAALKGIAIVAKAAKGILAIKPFLILGLLFLIAIPVLLLFLPIPIITVTGATAVTPGRSGRQVKQDPSVISYLTDLSQRVLTSEECMERFLCKLPKGPEPYQKKAKSLWDTYGETVVKNTRLARGIEAYFDSAKEKNRVFKCNQRFQCSNKYL